MYSKFGQFIDGKWQPSEKKETYDVINPATEEVIGKASKATKNDVLKALKSANFNETANQFHNTLLFYIVNRSDYLFSQSF